MDRALAAKICRDELDKFNLKDWGVRLNPVSLDSRFQYLGLCSYKDKTIILNAHHIDLHDEREVTNTIKHEVAHALTPGHAHDEVWAAKAREIGCINVAPCSHLGLPESVIDAIRSGATVEVTFEEEVIRRPKYQVTRLQDKCEFCGKVAVTKNEIFQPNKDLTKPDVKLLILTCGHILRKLIPKGTPFQLLETGGNPDCAHDWNEPSYKSKCMKCGRMRPYQFQLDGMEFIEAALSVNKGGAVFDEMGLGKTIQALGVIKFHPELWPVLYIVKSGLRFQWFKQIYTWMGDEFIGQIIQRSTDIVIPGLRTYVVSYDMLVPKIRTVKGKQIKSGFDITKFDGVVKTIVLDECQQIKNPDSTRTQQVRKIAKNTKVIALSGTPWKNRGSELFSVMNMLDPMKFSSFQGYKDRWVSYHWDGKYRKEGGIKNAKMFKDYVKDIAIRRERTEVMKELPLVNRMKLHIQLDELEQNTYDDNESDFVKWYNDAVIGGEEDAAAGSMNMLAQLSRMRHITGLAKIPATEEFVEEFVEETDRKLCIFVHHIDVGSILFDSLKQKYGDQMPVIKITGAMNGNERFEAQETFNNSPRCILVGSTLAAGEGLNLQTGADCIIHERQWNPANEEQAEGRFIRIGQTATSVNSTYVEAADTIDSMFDGIVERKRLAFHDAMNKGESPKWNQSELLKELAEAIVAKHRAKKAQSGKETVSIVAKAKV
jgi:hypothetical protein